MPQAVIFQGPEFESDPQTSSNVSPDQRRPPEPPVVPQPHRDHLGMSVRLAASSQEAGLVKQPTQDPGWAIS